MAARKKAKPKRRMTALDKAKAEIAALKARLNEALEARERAHAAAGRHWDRAQEAETAARQAKAVDEAMEALAVELGCEISNVAEALKKDAEAKALTSNVAALHLERLTLRCFTRRGEIRAMRVVQGEAMDGAEERKA